MSEQLVQLQRFEIARAHSVLELPHGLGHACRCGWHLPPLGFGLEMIYILAHYSELS